MITNPLFADIFIIEEADDVVRALRSVLQAAGYTVRSASNMEKALSSISSQTPDLILLSSGLPDIDNLAAIRLIRSRLKEKFVPLMVMAIQDSQTDRVAGLNAGADEFIGKPIDNTELLPRVRVMLRLKAAIDALNELNATLEQKVQERTRLLEQAQAHLRHAEKLSSLGRLSASIAHEINNPLNSIFLYLDLMQENLPPDSPLHKDLRVVNRQLGVIESLAQQLRDYSKPPRRDRYEIDLNSVLQEVLTLVGKELQRNHINVHLEMEPDLPPILASPEQVGEVFMNIILNAQDAMQNGGDISLSTSACNGTVRLQVKDTGIGMAQDVLERIFEPFFTTKGEKGTGLGLAVCYSIVQDHQGEIRVESQPGKGTIFEVTFPAMLESSALLKSESN